MMAYLERLVATIGRLEAMTEANREKMEALQEANLSHCLELK
jgi:hypothetical protein